MSKQVKIAAAEYEDQDDSLQAAADDYAAAHDLAGWDLAPKWEDEQREVIILTVPDQTTTEEFLLVLDAGREQDDGSIVVAVDDYPDDERTAQEAVEDGWGNEARRFFLAGWTAEWTGSGDTWGDGTNTSDVHLTPPDAE